MTPNALSALWRTARATHFNKTTAAPLFRIASDLSSEGWNLAGNRWYKDNDEFLPVYEGKMIWHFNHRAMTYEDQSFRPLAQHELTDPSFLAQPEYWINRNEINIKVPKSYSNLMGGRLISNISNRRTLIYSLFPLSAASHSLLIEFTPQTKSFEYLHISDHSSFIHDYITRQKIGGTNVSKFIYEQLPNIGTAQFSSYLNFSFHVAELAINAWDVVNFEQPQPYIWNEERRALIRAELDALMFHLYKIDRDDVGYIMDTFSGVCKDDVEEFGEYKTRRLILECFDRMAEFESTGIPYETLLNPPPADPSLRHALASRPDWADLYHSRDSG